jgi:hypothetical protein
LSLPVPRVIPLRVWKVVPEEGFEPPTKGL